LHLAVNGFRFDETLLLLEAGCDVFAKNSDSKTPRKVSNGNFLLTKLLRNFENNLLQSKLLTKGPENNNNCFTTVEDTSNIEDISSFIKFNKIYKDEKRENPTILSAGSEDLGKLAVGKNDSNKFLQQINQHIHKLKFNPDEDEPTRRKINFNINSPTYNVDKLSADFNRSIVNSKHLSETPQFFKGSLSKSQAFNRDSVMQNTYKSIPNSLLNTSTNQKISKINLFFHKEVILNYENSLAEKYESIMYLRMACGVFSPSDIETVVKSIIESLDFDLQVNCIIFVDLCNITIVNKFFNIIPILENIKRSMSTRKGIFYSIIENEINSSIFSLKALQEHHKLTNLHRINTVPARPKKSHSQKKVSSKKVIPNINPINRFIKNDNVDNSREEFVDKVPTNRKSLIPKLKSSSRYYDKSNDEKSQDDFQSDDMNEISQSYIDLKYYNKQIPKRCSRNEKDESFFGESCNVVDSSYSMIKQDDNKMAYDVISRNESKFLEKQNEHYAIINPKHIDTSYIDFEN
jgi:hypothetical protein